MTTDRLIQQWLTRNKDAGAAYNLDPTYHAQFNFMRRTLTAIDWAMEAEGIDSDIRARIVRSVLFGAPDETAALERHEQHLQKLSWLTGTPPPKRCEDCSGLCGTTEVIDGKTGTFMCPRGRQP